MSTTLTDASRTGRKPRIRLLRGLNWLVVRQHRASILAVLAMTALGALWIVHQRGQMHDALVAVGWPEKPLEQTMASGALVLTINALGALPVVLAVFLGATLVSADQEHGTAQLVTTQSVSRGRWLTAKLCWCHLTVIVCSGVVSALFTWWWKPYRAAFSFAWHDGPIFDNTGPVLPALSLFLAAAGVTIGLLLRRVLLSMVVTFGFAVFVEVAWGLVRESLASPRMINYPLNANPPAKLDGMYEMDRWVSSSDGTLFGYTHCSGLETEKAANACVKENGIVDNVVKYLGYDQMPAMQWTGAGFLLLGTIALTAFTLWRASRRPL
ncbi:ABC transporter permease [Streptomyces sp. NPDC000609]|uniref:ABC transporter permease n=1 Tax=Streptomyces sp. NPDC000609 TaxID=3160957 RepID=UPI003398F50F